MEKYKPELGNEKYKSLHENVETLKTAIAVLENAGLERLKKYLK